MDSAGENRAALSHTLQLQYLGVRMICSMHAYMSGLYFIWFIWKQKYMKTMGPSPLNFELMGPCSFVHKVLQY